MRIGIDIGHGGEDPGASGGGMQEKKINWNVAERLKAVLLENGYDVIVTRKGDTNPSKTARAKTLNAGKVDLWVGVHHNGGGGDGYDIIYQLDPRYTTESKRFASFLAVEFMKLNNKHRIFCKPSTKDKNEDWYTVAALTNAPGVISELAFLDTKDVETVDTLKEQWSEADAIFRAVERYFGR